jgi:hypothetical protein
MKYGFGIVDGSGSPYWGENCVNAKRSELQAEVDRLNADREESYHVVELYHSAVDVRLDELSLMLRNPNTTRAWRTLIRKRIAALCPPSPAGEP